MLNALKTARKVFRCHHGGLYSWFSKIEGKIVCKYRRRKVGKKEEKSEIEKTHSTRRSLMYVFFSFSGALFGDVTQHSRLFWNITFILFVILNIRIISVWKCIWCLCVRVFFSSLFLSSVISLNIWIENYFCTSEHNRANVSNNKFRNLNIHFNGSSSQTFFFRPKTHIDSKTEMGADGKKEKQSVF